LPGRHLIVNADDLGHSDAVNAGIAEGHERGIVTSASLMVKRDAAEEAAAYARSNPSLGIGLHLDLGEWIHREGEGWVALYEVNESDAEAEVQHQLARFRAIVGREPTHIDSHQHVHLREPARSVVVAAGRRLRIPVRHFDQLVRYRGDFYGQTETGESLPALIAPAALVRVLEELPEGVTELCCHPAKGTVPGSSYGAERERELAALCAPSVRGAVRRLRIALCSFADLSR
jgi:predicted glycoside hydrolase/deacetylase ChbG (UPF0249 family)